MANRFFEYFDLLQSRLRGVFNNFVKKGKKPFDEKNLDKNSTQLFPEKYDQMDYLGFWPK